MMNTIPRLSLALAGTLLACAPNSEIPEQRTDRSVVAVETTAGTSGLQLTRDAEITSQPIEVGADAAWAALPGVYEQLGIRVTGIDTASRLIITTVRVRRIDGKGAATFFNCPGAYGNLASTGDVYVTLRSQVVPVGDTTSTLRHEVEAVARGSTGGISQVRCSSKGSLEELLHETLQARLGAS